MLARWDGEGVASPSARWGGEGVATATGRCRAGRDVATGWRRRRSVWWGRRESWHQRHGHSFGGTAVLAASMLVARRCRWCGGVRWRSDRVGGMAALMGDGLVMCVVACRRALTALAAWRLSVTLATWGC
eukprot:7384464-Prymnesium_polylepis.1